MSYASDVYNGILIFKIENHFWLIIFKFLVLSMSICATSKITTSMHTEFEFFYVKNENCSVFS
jgi:hypothetical protein